MHIMHTEVYPNHFDRKCILNGKFTSSPFLYAHFAFQSVTNGQFIFLVFIFHYYTPYLYQITYRILIVDLYTSHLSNKSIFFLCTSLEQKKKFKLKKSDKKFNCVLPTLPATLLYFLVFYLQHQISKENFNFTIC